MKKPIAWVVTLYASILTAGVASAQTPPGAEPQDPQVHIAQLAKDLALTDAQAAEFQKILGEEHTNLVASMKQEREQNTDVQVAHQNHQKIEDAAMEKLKPVLSDAQFKKYQGIVEAEAYARHHRTPAVAPAS